MPSSSTGSCVGAAFYSSQGQGGVLSSDLSVAVTLGAAASEYALCLAHGPFAGASAVDSEYSFHPHVTASVSFEPPSLPPSPPPPATPPSTPPPAQRRRV